MSADSRGLRWMGRSLTHAFRTYSSGDPMVALCGALPHPEDEDRSRRTGRVCPTCSYRRTSVAVKS